jgi:hypothetical protein
VTGLRGCHFTGGLLVGNAHALFGFHHLYGYLTSSASSSSTSSLSIPILTYAVLWSLATSVTGYLWYSLLVWTTRWYSVHAAKPTTTTPAAVWTTPPPCLLLQYEYATYMGIFIGFCVGCTAANVVYGLPRPCVAATVALAVVWTALLMACARRAHGWGEDPTLRSTTLDFCVV